MSSVTAPINPPRIADLPVDFRKELDQVVHILGNYNARRVILYGSVARGDFRDDSNLDICVEGLDSTLFFRALGECLIAIERPVSLVDFANTYGYFRQRIVDEGKVIYEQ